MMLTQFDLNEELFTLRSNHLSTLYVIDKKTLNNDKNEDDDISE